MTSRIATNLLAVYTNLPKILPRDPGGEYFAVDATNDDARAAVTYPFTLASAGGLFTVDWDEMIRGVVTEGAAGVRMRTLSGGLRAIDYPVGEQLPRIC